MRRKLPALNRRQVLLLCNFLFYTGVVALVVCLVLFLRDMRLGVPQLVSMAIGILGTAGSSVMGMAYLNCPNCGKSMLNNGMLPRCLPDSCPDCGEKL